jgi:hypothetical protein
LTAVVCTRPRLAVGQSGASAVAARWDGSTWSSHTVPTPADIRLETLTGVSCSSASACVAVGTGAKVSQDGSVTAELAARWDGSTWAVGELPTPNGEESQLAVSCPAAASCVAVGGSSARRWDGATWSLRSVPVPRGVQSLNGLTDVSCTSVSRCLAIGTGVVTINGSGSAVPIAELWDATQWRAERMTLPSFAAASTLAAVS